MYWNSSREQFAKLDMATSVITDLDSLRGVNSIEQGASTYDAINNRYFHITNLGILVIDGATGNVMDTLNFPAGIHISSIEYDAALGKLVGVRYAGTGEKFCSIDLLTGAYTDVCTIPGVNTITQGESALDVYNGRYFINCGGSLMILDVSTGAVIDSVSYATTLLMGLEYDPNSNKLYGVRLNSGKAFFISLDLTTKTLTDIDTLNGINSVTQGLSTYNPVQNAYYLSTPSGILEIDPATGAVAHTYTGSGSLMSLEAVYQTVVFSMTQPQSQMAGMASSAQFSVATTAPTPSYQWQVYTPAGFVNIANGGQYNGVTTGTLSVSNVGNANNGQLYRCMVRSGGFSNPSRIATLRLNSAANVPAAATQGGFAMYVIDAGEMIVEIVAIPKNGVYYLYDASGRKVLTGRLAAMHTAITTDGLSAGLYALRVVADGQAGTFKVLR